jgi:protein-S-isoprenylcysteine O-methyltransferase Ste14
MKLLSDWGITTNWWRGDSLAERLRQRGEYWVIAQGVLLLVFALIPPMTSSIIDLRLSVWLYTSWILTAIFGILAIVFLGRSLSDLGQNLTPLPHPRDEGQLVTTGVYGLVRPPMYSGVIYLALAYAS